MSVWPSLSRRSPFVVGARNTSTRIKSPAGNAGKTRGVSFQYTVFYYCDDNYTYRELLKCSTTQRRESIRHNHKHTRENRQTHNTTLCILRVRRTRAGRTEKLSNRPATDTARSPPISCGYGRAAAAVGCAKVCRASTPIWINARNSLTAPALRLYSISDMSAQFY